MSIKRFWPWSDESLENKLIKAAEEFQHATIPGIAKRGGTFFEDKVPMEFIVEAYRRSKLPAHFVIAMVHHDYNCEIIADPKLTRKERRTIQKISRKSKKKSMRAAYLQMLNLVAERPTMSDDERMMSPNKDSDKLTENIEYAGAIKTPRLLYLPEIKKMDNPLEFLATATNAQMRVVEKMPSFFGGKSIQASYVQQIPDSLLSEVLSIFKFRPSGVKELLSDKPTETLEALSKYTNAQKQLVYSTLNPTTHGIILRVYGGQPTPKFKQFLADYKKEAEKEFLMTSGMEPRLDDFVTKYHELDKNQKIGLIIDFASIVEISPVPSNRKEYIFTLAAKFGFDSQQYDAGRYVEHLNISDKCKLEIAKNEKSVAFIKELPDEDSRQMYARFIDWTSPKIMATVSRDDFMYAAAAYNTVKDPIDVGLFVKGFVDVAKSGNLGSWAKAIIAHHQKGVVGGDSYRQTSKFIAA